MSDRSNRLVPGLALFRYTRRAVSLAALAFAARNRSGFAQEASPTPVAAFTNPQPDPAAADYGPTQATSAYRLALLVPFATDPFWLAVQEAASARALVSGVSLETMVLTDLASVPEQLTQITTAIDAGFDGVILGPLDSIASVPGIVSLNEAGIPVVVLDIEPFAGDVLSFVRTDNVAGAQLAGEYLGAELGGKGRVLNIQGDMSDVKAQERNQGFRLGLEEYPEITVKSLDGFWDFGSAAFYSGLELPVAEEGTPAPPKPLVDAIFAAGPEMALGAAEAVEAVQADSVMVVGFGGSVEVTQAIRDGTLRATVREYPERAGAIAVELLVRHLNGDEDVPAVVDSGSSMVFRET